MGVGQIDAEYDTQIYSWQQLANLWGDEESHSYEKGQAIKRRQGFAVDVFAIEQRVDSQRGIATENNVLPYFEA